MTKESNYNVFMSSNLDSFRGKWIAICEENIVSFGDDAEKTRSQQQLRSQEMLNIQRPAATTE